MNTLIMLFHNCLLPINIFYPIKKIIRGELFTVINIIYPEKYTSLFSQFHVPRFRPVGLQILRANKIGQGLCGCHEELNADNTINYYSMKNCF